MDCGRKKGFTSQLVFYFQAALPSLSLAHPLALLSELAGLAENMGGSSGEVLLSLFGKKVLGGSWEGLGRVLGGRSWDVLGGSWGRGLGREVLEEVSWEGLGRVLGGRSCWVDFERDNFSRLGARRSFDRR